MIYVYRPTASTGARDLAEGITLGGQAARRTRGLALRRLQNGDVVVCWGANFATPQGVRTLNNVAPLTKFAEARKLQEAGVPCVQVSQQQPNVRTAPRAPFQYQPFTANGTFSSDTELARFIQAIQAHAATQQQRRREYDAQPVVPMETWLPRSNRHVGGNDLLAPPDAPNFYSKKEDIVEEYRLHIFRGKSIRAGKKAHRTNLPAGQQPHAWIRSYNAGWFINYDGFESTKAMRDVAKKAVEALGLDFGAVDLGKKRDGSFIVLEVNRAPGVEGGTIETYAKHIGAWVRNPNHPNE